MRILAGVCLAALALAACGNREEKAQAPTAEEKATERPVPPGIDAAPRLKAGLWEVTAQIGGKAETLRACVDPAVQGDSAIPGQGLNRADCTKSDWTAMPGGVAFDLVCQNGPATLTSVGVVAGDFNSAYHFEADASMTKDGVTRSGKQVFDAKWVGACPSGMKPGERQRIVDGKTVVIPATVPG